MDLRNYLDIIFKKLYQPKIDIKKNKIMYQCPVKYYDFLTYVSLKINHLNLGSYTDLFFLFLHRLFKFENLLIYLGLFVIYISIKLIKTDEISFENQVALDFERIFILFISAFSVLTVILLIKNSFSCPRPLVFSQEIKILDRTYFEEYFSYDSFPSGHTAFVTLILLSLWDHVKKSTKLLLSLLLIIVAFSRIKLGVHFLHDVITGFLLTCLIYWLSVILTKLKIFDLIRKPTKHLYKSLLSIFRS